jgi:hypothetical protein
MAEELKRYSIPATVQGLYPYGVAVKSHAGSGPFAFLDRHTYDHEQAGSSDYRVIQPDVKATGTQVIEHNSVFETGAITV